jgi:hypothetical protein
MQKSNEVFVMKMKVQAAPRNGQEPVAGRQKLSASQAKDALAESRELAAPKGSKGRESPNRDARNVRTAGSIELAMWGDLLR